METNEESPFVHEVKRRDATAHAEDKSPFIREIEQRLDTLLGEEEKPGRPAEAGPENDSLREVGSATEFPEERGDNEERFKQLFGEWSASRSILYSPIKDLKSIILSLEWEIDALMLARYDKEVNRLDDLFTEDKVLLGFLRILRFLGRYLRVKNVDADPRSILLLMSVYDDFERIALSRDMAEMERHAILVTDIKRYQEWVDKVDLAGGVEEAAKDAVAFEKEKGTTPDSPQEIKPEKNGLVEDETPGPVLREFARAEEALTAAMKEMTPQEALAYTLEEIRKTIRTEFSDLRAELNLWKQNQYRD